MYVLSYLVTSAPLTSTFHTWPEKTLQNIAGGSSEHLHSAWQSQRILLLWC